MSEWIIILKAIGWILLTLVLLGIAFLVFEYISSRKKKIKERLRIIVFNIGAILIAWWAHGWPWEGEEGLIMYWIVIILFFIIGNFIAWRLYESKIKGDKDNK